MSRGKPNKKGRNDKLPSFTPMIHRMVDSPAFQALTPLAQCLYWRLRRLADYDGRRNGEVFFSTRDAAAMFHVHQDTIRKAFYELQAKGFIVATQLGSLGVLGEGKATLWRLTELPTPHNSTPTKEFLQWQPGRDFSIQRGKAPRNKKQNPALTHRAARPNGSGVPLVDAPHGGVACPNPSGVLAIIEPATALTGRAYKDLPGGKG